MVLKGWGLAGRGDISRARGCRLVQGTAWGSTRGLLGGRYSERRSSRTSWQHHGSSRLSWQHHSWQQRLYVHTAECHTSCHTMPYTMRHHARHHRTPHDNMLCTMPRHTTACHPASQQLDTTTGQHCRDGFYYSMPSSQPAEAALFAPC